MSINLKVLVYDHDSFALHAINSYLAWDRRTRVHCLQTNVENVFTWLSDEDRSEWPHVVIIDPFYFGQPVALTALIQRFLKVNRKFQLIVLDHEYDTARFKATLQAGGKAYFLRNDISIHIASTLVWLQDVKFGVSPGVAHALQKQNILPENAEWETLPDKRQYPELTDRIRQAIQLCVVEGMSADLAADEMGVSIHTIRSYIKEGYRILEAYDDNHDYPLELSAQERAFMRYTALEEENEDSADDTTKEDKS